MDLQSILNSRQAATLGLGLSRSLPPRLGRRLAYFVAARIAARRELPVVKAIRANQWVASGQKLSASQLDQAAVETLRHYAYSIYTLFHYLDNRKALLELVQFDAHAEQLIQLSRDGKQGIVGAGVHLSNFDLVVMAALMRGMRAQAISLPETSESVEWQHNLRRKAGLEIMPASMSSFRHAVHRLQAGECFMTGIDRPIAGVKYRPLFFGQPAMLPLHYIRLALQANAPIVVLAAILGPDGIYRTRASDLIEMQHYPNREDEILCNAERVLETAASFISEAPHQWTVVNQVWPEIAAKVP